MSQQFRFISAIFRSPWLLEQGTLESYFPHILAMQAGQPVDLKKMQEEAGDDDEYEDFPYYLRVVDDTGKYHKIESYSEAPEGAMAIIPIRGVMMAEDRFCGPAGTDTIAKMVASAERSSKVAGIGFDMRTPGGQVLGTEHLANTIAACDKPTAALANGLMASAGYWTGAATKRIFAAGKTTEMGSIGTMWSYADFRKLYEKMGVKIHDVKATKSPDKNADFDMAMEGKYDRLIKDRLDPTNEVFHQAVIANRGLNKAQQEAALTGKVFHAEKAISLGLADQIGTMDDMLDWLFTRAQAGQPTQVLPNPNPDMFGKNKQFAALLALAGMEEIQPEAIEAANAELQAAGIGNLQLVASADLDARKATITDQAMEIVSLKGALKAAKAEGKSAEEVAQLQQQITDLTTAKEAAEGAKATLEEENKELKARILATEGKDPKKEGADEQGKGAEEIKLNYA